MNLAVDCLGFMEIFIVSLFSSSVDLDLFVFSFLKKYRFLFVQFYLKHVGLKPSTISGYFDFSIF